MNRRDFFHQSAALRNSLGPIAPETRASVDYPQSGPPYRHVYPDMLAKYLAGKLNALAEKWDRERAGIRTPQQIETRNRFVLQKTAEMIHGLRPQRPLKSQVVKSFEREGYRVENILLETRPDYWVPGNIYTPTTGKGPYPGIISPCGHEVPGRMYVTFQSMHMALAKEGFVVWTYEPPEEGERRHYWNPFTGQNEIGGPVTWAHELEGQLLILIGEALTHYRIWDGMCGVDFLTSRPEVDPNRIGCTGQSGGGLYTMFLTALDSRIGCGASNQGGAENRWPIDLGPYTPLELGDIDQQLFPAAIYGIDQADFFMSIAPRPMLITTGYFEPRFNRTVETIRERYRLLGSPEKFATAGLGRSPFLDGQAPASLRRLVLPLVLQPSRAEGGAAVPARASGEPLLHREWFDGIFAARSNDCLTALSKAGQASTRAPVARDACRFGSVSRATTVRHPAHASLERNDFAACAARRSHHPAQGLSHREAGVGQ